MLVLHLVPVLLLLALECVVDISKDSNPKYTTYFEPKIYFDVEWPSARVRILFSYTKYASH